MAKKDYHNVSLQDLHDIFGHAKSTLIGWKKDKIIPYHDSPTGKKDVFDTRAVYEALVDKDVKKIIGEIDIDDDSGEITDNLERFRKYSADTKKFDLNIKKGEYILKEQILLDLRLLVTHAQKKFQMLGKELAFKLSTVTDIEEVENQINTKVIEILDGISLSRIPSDNEENE